MKKRIISLALCLLMVLGYVLPVAAVDSAEPACSGDCEDTSSAATHVATCAVYAYYESMSAKGAAHLYENWDGISESDQANLLVWLEAHDPDTAAELKALLGAEEETEPETTAPDETGETETISNGSFIVTGNLPEGAELVIGEYPTAYSADEDTPSVSMYSIKVYDGDEVWQPEDGETVKVSIPVTGSASTVNVVHFLEDPDKISYALGKGLAVAFDVSDNADLQEMFAASIAGYRAATGSSAACVVVEVFENVPVVGGKATVDANGFSIFELTDTGYNDISEKDFKDFPNTVYVRPGEWVTLFSWLGTYSKTDKSDIIVGSSEKEVNVFIFAYQYFQVSEDAPANSSFTVTLTYVTNKFPYIATKTVTFKVTEEYFEYDKTMLEVLPDSYSGYPAEPSVTTDTNFHYYQNTGDLTDATTTAAVYTTSPSELIDIDAVKASSAYTENSDGTAYGIADTTGVATKAVLVNFDELEADILEDYFAKYPSKYTDDVKQNYKIVVYVVKYEATGENIGWHIGCKVVPVDSFTLSYDYNPPAGFSAYDIEGNVVRPNDQIVSTTTDEDGTVTATTKVGSNYDKENAEDTTDPMVLKTTDPDNSNQEITAKFVCWNTDPNGAGKSYYAGDSITLTSDTTLYAIWTTGMHYAKADVTFRKQVKDESGAIVEDTTVFNFTANGFDGISYQLYTSAGAPNGAGTVDSAAWDFTLSNGESIVFYGVPNDGTYSIKETNIPTGYNAKNGDTQTITIDSTTNTSGKFSYDFINVKDTKYTVTYHTNYGTDGTTTVTKDYNKTLTLSAALTRTGYTFEGWNTAADGSGTSYAAGAAYTDNADLELYAQWTVVSYTITYSGLENATVSGNPASYTIESDQITLNNPTRVGYTFAGWTGTDLTGATETVTISTGSTGNREYTATWTPLYKYVLVFDANTTDAKVSGMPAGYTSADWEETSSYVYNISGQPTRTGYTFKGWSTTANAESGDMISSITLNGVPADTKTVTLYAVWKANTYTITLNTDGGDAIRAMDYTIENDIKLPTPTKTGFEFQGWQVEVTDGNWAAVGTSVSLEVGTGKYGNVTLKAIWKGLYSYQLTFNANQPAAVTGWSVQNMPTSDSTDWIGEATHTFSWSTNPTLKGYTFKGWATSADGTATYNNSIQLTGTPGEATSQTLYAIWEENTVTITYQAEANGQVSMESETIGVVTGSPVGATATPVSYYQFVGWYKDDTKICESEQFNAFEKVDGLYVAGTYTAKFELAQTDLTIYANGGDGEQTYLYTVTGTGVSLTVAVPQGGHVTIKGLPVGTYTVTEKSDWTWRYSPTGGATQTVVVDSVAETVTFEHTANSNTQWLNGYDYKAFK